MSPDIRYECYNQGEVDGVKSPPCMCRSVEECHINEKEVTT